MRLSYHSPWNTASEPGALLAKKLADLAPGDLNTVFFTTGGSTAVDTALRFMHFYNNRLGRPDKKVVGLEGSRVSRLDLSRRLGHRQGAQQELVRRRLRAHASAAGRQSVHEAGTGRVSRRGATRRLRTWRAAIAEIGPRQGRRLHRPSRFSRRAASSFPRLATTSAAWRCAPANDVLYISDEVVTRLRTAGPLVCVGGRVRNPARHDHLRQGAHVRLPAAGGMPDFGPAAGADFGPRARGCPVLQRLHLFPAIRSPAPRR